MNVCIINDLEEDEFVSNLISAGKQLGKVIAHITPAAYTEKQTVLSLADLIILIGIKRYPYAHVREILTECFERRCPYVTIETNLDKLSHAYIEWSFYSRATEIVFISDEIREVFSKTYVYGSMHNDPWAIWRTIDKAMRKGDVL